MNEKLIKTPNPYRSGTSNYDKYPFIQVTDRYEDCSVGWDQISARLSDAIDRLTTVKKVIIIETYHGVFMDSIKNGLIDPLKPHLLINTTRLFKSESQLDQLLEDTLGDHPVFGYMADHDLKSFFAPDRLQQAKADVLQLESGMILIFGPGASLVSADANLFVYADLARWEIQQRMRKKQITNLGSNNLESDISDKYKRAYFVDWRVCDKLKQTHMKRWDYLLDTNDTQIPKMISGELFRKALAISVKRPLRVVPFFDPGVWGGQWMRKVCALSDEPVNYAWCFDCVPEENSLLLAFGDRKIEIPSINLVFNQPQKLLGEKIYQRFGAEFPIRFDFLDTMDGGNLSLQVHPLQKYMQENFGLKYTQDESYYLLDAKDDAVVYLGLKEDVDSEQMIAALERAKNGQELFNADQFVQKWPVKKHDHILIPAGTIHCSGRNSMVLEISATPYIFTFKLWDWGRVDLNGKPRPISLNHGQKNICWERSASWVEPELVNRILPIAEGKGWKEEKTGLHDLEFIETRRHWFTEKVSHHTKGNLNVLNLVSGDEVLVESPNNSFEPFIVHYAETFIVPAAVGEYTIRPHGKDEVYATIKAYVR